MSSAQTVLLGALAGFTIFLGLPLARLRSTNPLFPAALGALALGILLFLLWDVLAHAVEPVEEALDQAVDGEGWGDFVGLAALLAGGVALGLMSLVYYDRWMDNRIRPSKLIGPGAAAMAEYEERPWLASLTPGRRLALLIATGIGLHNFGEGLAIGQSAASGEIALALTLIIGFGLHNTTEGFGIVGPMAGEAEPPSWAFLALLGLIGGGPTFVGTIVGQAWVSEAVSVLFFAVAAGSILFVVQELFAVTRRFNQPVVTTWLLLLGLALGFGTDFVLEAVGG
jgi:ZIP family zinc transporter